MSNAQWSDDRVTLLSKLWLDGLSASQIAKQLGGVTRNAVIGKVHRLGLEGRSAPSQPARAPRPTPARRVLATPAPPRRRDAPTRFAPAAPEGPGLAANLIELGAQHCKWPIGDPKRADFTFCGTRAEGPYCAAHKALSVRPGTALRADRDPVLKRALAGLV